MPVVLRGKQASQFARAAGVAEPKSAKKRAPKRDLLPESFEGIGTGFKLVVGVYTCSEANQRSKWGAIGRVHSQRVAVSRAMAKHWKYTGPVGDLLRNGERVRITLTRIGGQGLDTGNLWRALKAVEDAVAMMIGVDDGSAIWKAGINVAEQPGSAYGVEIKMEVL